MGLLQRIKQLIWIGNSSKKNNEKSNGDVDANTPPSKAGDLIEPIRQQLDDVTKKIEQVLSALNHDGGEGQEIEITELSRKLDGVRNAVQGIAPLVKGLDLLDERLAKAAEPLTAKVDELITALMWSVVVLGALGFLVGLLTLYAVVYAR